jgi:hypothetical protein
MDNFDGKNSQRNRSNKNNDIVDEEVKKLFRKVNGRVSTSDFIRIREKYNG